MLSDKPFTRKRIEQLFTDLGARLERRGVTGEVLVFGGAAMILAFNARAATRDIDAVSAPDDAVRTAADEVAQEHGLPRSWLNNQASSYLSLSAAEGKVPAFEAGGLRVYALAPQQLLAMKAGRPSSARRAGHPVSDQSSRPVHIARSPRLARKHLSKPGLEASRAASPGGPPRRRPSPLTYAAGPVTFAAPALRALRRRAALGAR